MQSTYIQKQIGKIFDADWKDRSSGRSRKYSDERRFEIIRKHDSQRRNVLEKALNKNPKLRGIDYFRAAMIFQHGQNLESIRKARYFAKKSFLFGYETGKWLYAAATDRLLMMQNKKQKFGTQFRKRNGVWELHPIRKATTDRDRKRYSVLPLHKIKLVLSSLNGKSRLYRTSKKTIGLTQQR